MHWEWAASSAMGATAPSATRFVPPKLPPPVGASDQPSFVEHPHPSRTTPELLGPARGCPTDAGVVTWRGSGHTQSKAKPGLEPASCTVLTKLRCVSLEIVQALPRK